VTVDLVGELASIDPALLDDDGRLGLAVAWARVENYAAARKSVAVRVFAGPAPVSSKDPYDPAIHAWSSVRAALARGEGASTRLVTIGRELDRFGATRAAMACGDLSFTKAGALTDATAALTDEQAAAVEARVLPKAAGRTPAQHAKALRRAVD